MRPRRETNVLFAGHYQRALVECSAFVEDLARVQVQVLAAGNLRHKTSVAENAHHERTTLP